MSQGKDKHPAYKELIRFIKQLQDMRDNADDAVHIGLAQIDFSLYDYNCGKKEAYTNAIREILFIDWDKLFETE